VKKDMHKHLQRDLREENAKIPRIEPEPALTIDQITEIETQIQAGLLEEIIQVAEGENQLVDTLAQNKV
jgi:NADH dehydrogenase (ubiquinone) 1 alpha subcomplex subunit 5